MGDRDDIDDEWRAESETTRGHIDVLFARLQILRDQLPHPARSLLDWLVRRTEK